MPALPTAIAGLGLVVLAGCTPTPERLEGGAGPVVTASAAGSAAPPAPIDPVISPASTPPSGSPSSTIRRTDWANVTLGGVSFMNLGDLRFRNGKASSGANNCTMLPGGAKPAYAEFLTEEPAGAAVTEDALILIECGSDGLDQALVPVQIGFDGNSRRGYGFIPADTPTGPGSRMTFTSYRVERSVIVTDVREADGSRETRRYRFGGGTRWERV